ncbi:hypothetical protein EDB81DRAFT_857586 [Dactylonectria macrodidyma]|uniref:Zn(2)-C6 fungal-type domain-containing protein n=1 Tax=Dactylonectria macrodidyma TaxID=307937 RepID=A0A9P9J3G0_9HYPO|nr:hypothetical protein EDB81DRAFT_857586 [Dactylonectria macrodidyma]
MPYGAYFPKAKNTPSDLLKRHWRRHLSDPTARSKLAESIRNASNRVARACAVCAASKLKCSDTKPCQRCVRRNIVCQYVISNRHPESGWGADQTLQGHQMTLDENKNVEDGDDSRVGVSPQDSSNSESSDEETPLSSRELQDQHQEFELQLPGCSNRGNASFVAPELAVTTVGNATLGGDMDTSLTGKGRASTIGSANGDKISEDIGAHPRGNDVFASGVNHFDEGDVPFSRGFFGDLLPENPDHPSIGIDGDFDILDSFMDPSFDWTTDLQAIEINHRGVWRDRPPPEQSTSNDAASTSTNKAAVIYTAVSAYKASVWNWIPSASDSALASQKDISPLPTAVDSTESWHEVNPGLLGKRCLSSDRSRILETLIATCSKDLTVRLVSSFPSPQFMSHLMHVFLHRHGMRKLSWIHIPTFDPCTSLEQLLITIIAVGACLTQAQPVQRLGYAILELMKTSITTQRYGLTDVLLMLDTRTMVLEWQQKEDRTGRGSIATPSNRTYSERQDGYESNNMKGFLQAYGMKERPSKKSGIVGLSKNLERDIRYDAQMSMVNSHAPVMSPSEMRLQLPESDVLWRSETAEEWKWHFFGHPPIPNKVSTSMAASVRAVLTDSSHLESTKDDPPSHMVMLYAMWRFVWQYREHCGMLSGSPLLADQSSLLCAHLPALTKTIQNLYGVSHSTGFYSDYRGVDPELALLHAFLLLNLYAPLDDLQAFAGRYGEGEAHQAYSRLEEWTLTREARLATWYASQTLQASKSLAKHLLSEFYAFALYEASITLFGYGAFTAKRGQRYRLEPQSGLEDPQDEEEKGADQVLWLCSGPIHQIHKFVALDVGKPAIRGLESPSSRDPWSWSVLRCPGRTLNVVIQILTRAERNEPGPNVLPGFVEGIVVLLRELVAYYFKLP